MRNRFNIKHVLFLLTLMVLLLAAASAMAQEGTAEATEQPAAEATVAPEGEVTHEGAPAEAAAESGGGIAALGLNGGYLVAQIVNFVIIFGALSLMLWRPIINMLDARSAKIEKGLEDAAVAANARRNAEVEAERILAAARTEASQVIEEARGKGEEVARQVEAEARAEADKIRADGRQAVEGERNAQLAGLRGQVAAISIAVAQRLIGETLDEKRQQALINDFFAKVPAEAKSLSGSVEVISAMPLSDDEQAKAKKEIGAANVTFTVDPSILGGLIVRSADKVVDASVRSGLGEVANRLK
ncbi:MAG: F0F1 ATP synthase subunit B [Anaerolineae bacterium]|nr:F0F1 ATP synthase subunit B [Anaerolineae bacterium]